MSLTKVTYSMINGAPLNVFDYGVTGDGVTDDTANLQAAIDAAQTAEKQLVVPPGNYKVTQLTVDCSKPFTLLGAGKDAVTFSSTRGIFSLANTKVGDTTLTAAIAFGASTITVASATGIQKGQLLVIRSTESFEETERSGTKDAAFVVADVSGTTVTLETSARFTFSVTGYTPTVWTYDIPQIQISGVTFSSTMASDAAVILGDYVGNVSLVDCAITDPSKTDRRLIDSVSGAQFNRSANIVVDGVDLSYMGYAIYLIATCNSKLSNLSAYLCRHTENVALGASLTLVENSVASTCYAGFDSHQEAMDTKFVNCESTADAVPCKFRGRQDIVINSTFSAASFETDAGIVADSAFADGTDQSYFIRKDVIGCTVGPDTTAETIKANGIYVNFIDSVFLGCLYQTSGRYVTVDNCYFNSLGTANCRIPTSTVKGVYINTVAVGTGGASRALNFLAESADSRILIDGCSFDGFDVGVRFSATGDRPFWNISNSTIKNCTTAGVQFAGATAMGAMQNLYFTGNIADISGTVTKSANSYTLT